MCWIEARYKPCYCNRNRRAFVFVERVFVKCSDANEKPHDPPLASHRVINKYKSECPSCHGSKAIAMARKADEPEMFEAAAILQRMSKRRS